MGLADPYLPRDRLFGLDVRVHKPREGEEPSTYTKLFIFSHYKEVIALCQPGRYPDSALRLSFPRKKILNWFIFNVRFVHVSPSPVVQCCDTEVE